MRQFLYGVDSPIESVSVNETAAELRNDAASLAVLSAGLLAAVSLILDVLCNRPVGHWLLACARKLPFRIISP